MNLTQPVKRRSTAQTKAGQYMCFECGEIFDTKKEVENHRQLKHNPHLRTSHKELYAY